MAGRALSASSSHAQPLQLRVIDMAKHLIPITKAAEATGIRVINNNHQDENDWDILWSFRTAWDNRILKDRAKHIRQRPSTLVNHLPGTLRLASKAHLPLFAKEAGLSNATPASYLLPEQIDQLLTHLRSDSLTDSAGLPRWLLKSKQHRNVRVLTNATRAGLSKTGSAIAQRRVRPLLLKGLGRAFDVGIYVLVASVRPLRIYAFDRSLVRICEQPFPTSYDEFVARPASFVINHYSPIWTLPFFADALKECDKSAACALRHKLKEHGHDADGMWRRMEGIAAELLAFLRPHVEAGLLRVGLRGQHTFELFRFDFMVDEEARPMLTEVNISPNMVQAHAEDGQVKSALLRDLFRILSARLRLQHEPPPPAPRSFPMNLWPSSPSPPLSAAEAERKVAGGWKRVTSCRVCNE